MLTIRHLNGALAGTEVKIENKDRVVVGRQLDCDVQYPPEETAVARHHFALVRKPSGSWTVELFGTPFVAIDGTPAVAAVAVVVALGGGVFAAYNYVSTSNTTARLDAAQKEFADTLAREANLRIGSEVRAHLSRAVYHAQLQDADQHVTAGGTAWVVGSNLLATNAHVAILREG